MQQRYERLFKILNGSTDAVVIANGSDNHVDHNFRYFVRPNSGIFEGSVAIITKRGIHVITSPLEAPALDGLDVQFDVIRTKNDMGNLLRKSLHGFSTIGMNFPAVTHESFRSIRKAFKGRIVDCSGQLADCRAVKDEGEISAIASSCRIASRVADMIPGFLKEGMTERKLSSLISKALYEQGSESPSFAPIVSFGRTSAIPHYSPGDLKLKRGNLVLADFGGTYKRYCSDITRTFVFGKASSRQKNLYETVLRAQSAAMSEISPGATGKDVDAAARNVIDSSEFKGTFIHSLGHGLGLQVHDGLPSLSPSSKGKLESGMVVTVEPGAYLQGFGGVRIEDDVVVTSSSPRILTDADRQLIEC